MTWGADVTLSVVERSFDSSIRLAQQRKVYSSVAAVASLCAATPSLSREGFFIGEQSPQSASQTAPLAKGSLEAVGFSKTASVSKHSFSPLCARGSPRDCCCGLRRRVRASAQGEPWGKEVALLMRLRVESHNCSTFFTEAFAGEVEGR